MKVLMAMSCTAMVEIEGGEVGDLVSINMAEPQFHTNAFVVGSSHMEKVDASANLLARAHVLEHLARKARAACSEIAEVPVREVLS